MAVHPGMGWSLFWQCCQSEECAPEFVIGSTVFHLLSVFMFKRVRISWRHRYITNEWIDSVTQLLIGATHDREMSQMASPCVIRSDTIFIVFTSGSTGRPKPVLWTQTMFEAQVETIRSLYPELFDSQSMVLVGVVQWLLMSILLKIAGVFI